MCEKLIVIVALIGFVSKVQGGDLTTKENKYETYSFEDSGKGKLVCTEGGCNTTLTQDEGILTDVIVQVKTHRKVNLNNTTKEDVSREVPVIAGTSEGFARQNSKSNPDAFVPTLPTVQQFGDEPPRAFAWYPKGGAAFNPVEFKRFERPTWRRVQHPQQFQRGATSCVCRNPGLGWYPTTPTFNYDFGRNDAVDDKLGELN